MLFALFQADGMYGAAADTRAAARTVLVNIRIGPHIRLERAVYNHAAKPAGDSLFGNQPPGKTKGPQPADKSGCLLYTSRCV